MTQIDPLALLALAVIVVIALLPLRYRKPSAVNRTPTRQYNSGFGYIDPFPTDAPTDDIRSVHVENGFVHVEWRK